MKSLRLRLIAVTMAIAAITTICVLRNADDATENEYRALLDEVIANSARPDSLKTLIARTPKEWQDDMKYLIAYMLPETVITALSAPAVYKILKNTEM